MKNTHTWVSLHIHLVGKLFSSFWCHTKDHQVMCASKGGRTNGTGVAWVSFLDTFGSAPIFYFISFDFRQWKNSFPVFTLLQSLLLQGVWLFCCFSLSLSLSAWACRNSHLPPRFFFFNFLYNAVDNQKIWPRDIFFWFREHLLVRSCQLIFFLFFSTEKRFQSHAEQTVTVRRDFVEPSF